MQRIWRQGGGIVLVQLDERLDEIGRGGVRGGITVGLELVATRQQAAQRRCQKAEYRDNFKEQDQRHGGIVGACCVDAESCIEPSGLHGMAEQIEQEQRRAENQDDALDDVAMAEMSQLMRQHRFHFGRVEPAEQGIEEDDALVPAETGEISIAVSRALGTIHDKQTRYVSSSLRQRGG